MALSIPTSEPESARAGDTWTWYRQDLADYPASTWTLTYYFRNSTAYFNVSASAEGDYFLIDVAPATTVAYTSGHYDWYAFVTDGTDRYQVDSGRINVLPDVSIAAAYDGRCMARKMVDYIDAILLNRASADQLDVINTQLASRALSRDRGGLLTLRSQMLIEAKREEGENPGRTARIVARFV